MLQNDPEIQSMLVSLQEMGMLDSSSDEESEIAQSQHSTQHSNWDALEAFSRKNQVVQCEQGGIDLGMSSSDNSRASSIAEVPFSGSAAKEFMAELERLHAEENWSSSESEIEVGE